MSTEVSAAKTLLATSTRTRRIKRYAWLAAGALALLGSCYVLGYLRGHGELSAVELQNQKLSQAKVDDAKQLETERARSQMLEGRRCLDQAVMALDYRNFGTAQERLKQAGQRIVGARAEGRLLAIGKELDTYRLVATEDLGNQRQKLVSYLTEFDQLYPAR